MSQSGKHTDSAEELPEEGHQALSMLHNVWQAHGQSSDDIAQSSSCGNSGKHKGGRPGGCKDLTFEAMAEEFEPTTDTGEAIDTLQAAWRDKLEREGKLESEGKTLGDLVLGDSDSTE